MHAALSERTRPATVRAADAADAERLFDTLSLAFAADPVTRWFFPDPQQYAECFPQFAKAFGGGAIANGTAFVSEDGAGAALWLDPDAAPDEQALQREDGLVDLDLRDLRPSGGAMLEVDRELRDSIGDERNLMQALDREGVALGSNALDVHP